MTPPSNTPTEKRPYQPCLCAPWGGEPCPDGNGPCPGQKVRAHDLLEQDAEGSWACSCGESGVERYETWTEHVAGFRVRTCCKSEPFTPHRPGCGVNQPVENGPSQAQEGS